MPKEKSFNPAAAQRKADKQREIARNKRQVQSQRNEKLARRNPDRLQRQIDELKDLGQRSALRPKDREILERLEREVHAIRKARDSVGSAAPNTRDSGAETNRLNARDEDQERGRPHQKILGKRQWRDVDEVSPDEGDQQAVDIAPETRAIPMPRDTPPPFPRQSRQHPGNSHNRTTNHGANAEKIISKTVYSSAPQIRDLKKEALRFVPSKVASQKERIQGHGRLLEPEEIDRLEKAGYSSTLKMDDGKEQPVAVAKLPSPTIRAHEVAAGLGNMNEKLFSVHMEEVEDEGD